MFLATTQRYTDYIYQKIAEVYNGCSFIPLAHVYIGSVVVLPDPLRGVQFMGLTRWEISGDYCSFIVVDKDDNGLVLQPTSDMQHRKQDSKLDNSDYHLSISGAGSLLLVTDHAVPTPVKHHCKLFESGEFQCHVPVPTNCAYAADCPVLHAIDLRP